MRIIGLGLVLLAIACSPLGLRLAASEESPDPTPPSGTATASVDLCEQLPTDPAALKALAASGYLPLNTRGYNYVSKDERLPGGFVPPGTLAAGKVPGCLTLPKATP